MFTPLIKSKHLIYRVFIPVFRYVKVIKIHQDFPELQLQMYCHLFYGSQCIFDCNNRDANRAFVTFHENTAPMATTGLGLLNAKFTFKGTSPTNHF